MSNDNWVDNTINKIKSNKILSRVILVGMIIIAVAGTIAAVKEIKHVFFPPRETSPIVIVDSQQEAKRCSVETLPKNLFKNANSTKILIAVFEGGTQEAKEFGTDISMSIADRLDEYRKDILGLSVEDIEPVRLNCFVQSHLQAREILDSLGGDIFIWGNNFCSPTSEKAKFCPKATLTKRISPLEAIGERIGVKEQLAITDLDLPSLTAEKPYQLLNFIFGLHFYLRGKFKEAGVYFEKAGDEIYGNEKGIEHVYHYLAYTNQFLSKNDKALNYYEKSLEMIKEVGDPKGEGVTLNNIGGVYDTWGKYDQAIEYYNRSLKIFEDIGDRNNEGGTLNNIGMVYYAWGKYDKAIEYYKKSLKITEEVGDRQGEGVTLNNIGEIYRAWGKYDQAIEYYKKSLKIFEDIGTPVEANTVRENLKLIQEKMRKR